MGDESGWTEEEAWIALYEKRLKAAEERLFMASAQLSGCYLGYGGRTLDDAERLQDKLRAAAIAYAEAVPRPPPIPDVSAVATGQAPTE